MLFAMTLGAFTLLNAHYKLKIWSSFRTDGSRKILTLIYRNKIIHTSQLMNKLGSRGLFIRWFIHKSPLYSC